MKPTLKLLTVLAFAIILTFSFCKKSEIPPTPDNRTKVELILAGTWKWSTSTCNVPVDKDGKDGASTDILSQYPACYSDATFTFKGDSTCTILNNVKCKSNEAASAKVKWMFINNDKILKWNNFDFTLVEISGTKLVLSYTETAGSETYLITDVYVHL